MFIINWIWTQFAAVFLAFPTISILYFLVIHSSRDPAVLQRVKSEERDISQEMLELFEVIIVHNMV